MPEAVRNTETTMNPNTKAMSPAMLQDDKDAVTAILAMADYTSLKPKFQKTVVYQKEADDSESGIRVELTEAEADYQLKEIAFNDARDNMVPHNGSCTSGCLVRTIKWRRNLAKAPINTPRQAARRRANTKEQARAVHARRHRQPVSDPWKAESIARYFLPFPSL